MRAEAGPLAHRASIRPEPPPECRPKGLGPSWAAPAALPGVHFNSVFLIPTGALSLEMCSRELRAKWPKFQQIEHRSRAEPLRLARALRVALWSSLTAGCSKTGKGLQKKGGRRASGPGADDLPAVLQCLQGCGCRILVQPDVTHRCGLRSRLHKMIIGSQRLLNPA